jgi:hypothetical protein
VEWEVVGGPIDHAEPGVDGSGWVWVLRRGEEVRHVFVQISGPALAVSRGLAADTEQAIATRGGSEIDKAARMESLPRLINCTTVGCAVVDDPA